MKVRFYIEKYVKQGMDACISWQEHELVDLLSQYEDQERSGLSHTQMVSPRTSHTYSQPPSVESHSPMDAVHRAMAARVAEEEQTQRVMIELNEMKPSYPGKTNLEVQTVLDEVSEVGGSLVLWRLGGVTAWAHNGSLQACQLLY